MKKDKAFTTAKTDVSAEAEAFRSVSEWLQDTAFTEKNYCVACCVAYRVLIDKSVFSEKDKLAAKEFLAEKVLRHGVAPVVDEINRGVNKTNIVELIHLITALTEQGHEPTKCKE